MDIRLKSSSGGVFSAIAEYILKNGGIVWGAAYSKDLTLTYQYVENIEDLDRLRRSKYVQAEVNDSFKLIKEQLRVGKNVLFTGTSCHIRGLYSYLPKKLQENLITIDFICHGVPSPSVFKKYINWLEKKYNDKLVDFNFRDKQYGWDNGVLTVGYFQNQGKKIFMNDENSYFYGMLHDMFIRPCCHECQSNGLQRESDFTIADFWGIGRRIAVRLKSVGVETAWDFVQKSESWVRKELTVTGLRTWKELKGEDCISIDELPNKKSICTSRSFPREGVGNLDILEEAVANFAAQCARKLKENRTVCKAMTVFAYTSRFRNDLPSDYIHRDVFFQVPTNDIREIVSAAVKALRGCWKGNQVYLYKKAGVIVWDTCSDGAVQGNLFDTIDRGKQMSLAKAIDEINRKNGFNTIRVAVQGYGMQWKLKNEYVSKRYTTNLEEIIDVHLE